MATAATKGRDAEVRIEKLYKEAGWDVERRRNTSTFIKGHGARTTSRDFFGLFDLICLSSTWRRPHFVQVTINPSTASTHRADIKDWLDMASGNRGATFILYYWQRTGPNKNRWIRYLYGSHSKMWEKVALTRAQLLEHLTPIPSAPPPTRS